MNNANNLEKELTGYPSIDKPWLKYYTEEAINAHIPDLTIFEYTFDSNQDNLQRVAMNYYGTNLSYGQMFRQISLFAGKLENIGIKAGDVVTVAMINSPETIMLIFALNKIGAVANMVYGSSSVKELKRYMEDTKSTIVFTLDMFQDKFEELADAIGIETVVISNITQSMSLINRLGAKYIKGMKPKPLPKDSRYICWKDFFKDGIESKTTFHDASAPAVIVYTGGTTGGSKGAILSSRSLISVALQLILAELEKPTYKRANTIIQSMPLFIAYGISNVINSFVVGMKLIVRLPMTDSIAQLCKKFKPNHIIYGPVYWEAFADENVNIDVSYLFAPTTGGDILKIEVENKINAYLKSHGCRYPIINGYGMTEVSACVACNFLHSHKLGSVGIPLVMNIISAFDTETGKELKYDEVGEICICTPSMMMGYANNSSESQNIMRKHDDGRMWVHSGDLGYVTEDGFVFIIGRMKRYFLYIANGLHKKIFTVDIEKVLLNHPRIDNCAVVPVADDVTCQKPVAYIISEGKNPSNKSMENELKTYCEQNLPDGYRPVKFILVDKFPLTKVGKVDYLTLEKMAENQNK